MAICDAHAARWHVRLISDEGCAAIVEALCRNREEARWRGEKRDINRLERRRKHGSSRKPAASTWRSAAVCQVPARGILTDPEKGRLVYAYMPILAELMP